MRATPLAPLSFALLGLIPFVWGAATVLNDTLSAWGAANLGPRFVGPYIQLFYGAVILAFMSGVLWGFATKADGGRAATGYALSVLPALWAFFSTGGGPVGAGTNLIFGFAGLLLLDVAFWVWRLAPDWWLALRVPMTVLVIACLGVGVFL